MGWVALLDHLAHMGFERAQVALAERFGPVVLVEAEFLAARFELVEVASVRCVRVVQEADERSDGRSEGRLAQ